MDEIEKQKQELFAEMREGRAEQQGYSSGELTEGKQSAVEQPVEDEPVEEVVEEQEEELHYNDEETSEEKKKEE